MSLLSTVSILTKMKKQRIISDIGRVGDSPHFPLEEKIKEHKRGIDYTVDETGNIYTILSEKLKEVIWPNDNCFYDESIVVIDRQKLVQKLESDRPNDPNWWVHEYFRNRVLEGEKKAITSSNVPLSDKIKEIGDNEGGDENQQQNFTQHHQIPPKK